jgi:hypothetical protein
LSIEEQLYWVWPVVMLSCGVYLYHWPVFALVDSQQLDVSEMWLFMARAAVTIGLAAASFRLLQQPVRSANWNRGRSVIAGVGASLLVAATASVVILRGDQGLVTGVGPYATTGEAGEITEIDGTLAPLVTLVAPTSSSTSALPDGLSDDRAPTATSTPSLPAGLLSSTALASVRIVVVGDSTAQFTGEGLVAWAQDHPTIAQVRHVDDAQQQLRAAGSCAPGASRPMVISTSPEHVIGSWTRSCRPCSRPPSPTSWY